MTTIREELVERTNIDRNRGETDEAFRKRLIDYMGGRSFDATYKTLSYDTKQWVNKAITAYNDTGRAIVFDDEQDDYEQAAPPAAEPARPMVTRVSEQPPAPAPTPKVKAAKPKAKAKAKAKKVVKPRGKPTLRPAAGDEDGGLYFARQVLVGDPMLSLADLRDRVKKGGFDIGDRTLSTLASGFRADVRALQEKKLLRKQLIA